MPGWWRGRRPGSAERRPRPRVIGCLIWLIGLIVVLIILSLLFGGFRKGTKAGGIGPLWPAASMASKNAAMWKAGRTAGSERAFHTSW